MNNTDEKQNLPLVHSDRLNNFEHRADKPPAIQEPADLVTSATPAHKERLVYLVDDAIDAIESLVHSGSEKVRLAAAQDIMDRAGLPKNTKTTTDSSPVSAIPAEVFTEFVKGLAQVFDVRTSSKGSFSPKDVTPKKAKKKPEEEKKDKPKGLPSAFLKQFQED